jgi:two-component system, chemotaxis family, sensor kinase Cph1
MEKEIEGLSLRALAMEKLGGRVDFGQSGSDDVQKLVEELTIHQEELRIQNEELLRVQIELEASRARYFELYDLAPVGYITLTPELVIREANLAASRLLGNERTMLINKRLSSFIAPNSQEQLHLHYRRLDQESIKRTRTLRVRKNDGGELLVRFESNRMEGGPHKGFRSVLTDVTELKLVEEANAELQQFAYVASHDLQEPLRMVISYLSLLQKKYQHQLDQEGQEYIQYAFEGGTRMRLLIDDLLEYSRLDSRNRAFPVDMNIVVNKTAAILKMQIDENKVKIISSDLPMILADESQMILLMQNLIGNAIKFHGTEPPEIKIGAEKGESEWTFSIEDNGIGLNMEYSEKIFQMFQRLNGGGAYQGTGVGLAIAKKIVERLGGRIWVKSLEGKGATFFFTIPRNLG